MSDEGEINWDYFIFSRNISLAGNIFNYAAVIAVRIKEKDILIDSSFVAVAVQLKNESSRKECGWG